MSLGIADSPVGRARANTVKIQIETDFVHGYYDPSLKRYRPKTIGKNPTSLTTVELFDRFAQHQQKDKGLTQSTIDTKYWPVQRMLQKYLDLPAADVDKRRVDAFAVVCDETLQPGTAKARISLLTSAWEWAKDKYEVDESNPWKGIARRFRSQPVQSAAAFTKSEVERIIIGFWRSPYYQHYADYVVFLFGMGCRLGEASGLKWKHVSPDGRSVWFGESYSRGVQGSTKTKRSRTVVMSESIAAMLTAKKERLNPQPEDRVFTTLKGMPIHDHNFRSRAWKAVLSAVEVEYRKPYTTRKTAISHALANGANYIAVAEAAGHDPQTMHKYYASSINKQGVFIEF
jgi:integrase